MFLRTGSAEINQDALLNCSMLLVASEGLGVVALMLECHFSSLLKLDPPVEIGTPFFSSHLFSRVGSGWSCFTGQLPGMCHLYTGGSGCAAKQGQVQATAP